MITIRGYYQSTNNYELDLQMTEEEYFSLSLDEQWNLIHNKLAKGEGYNREFINEENYGILYIKDSFGDTVPLHEED